MLWLLLQVQALPQLVQDNAAMFEESMNHAFAASAQHSRPVRIVPRDESIMESVLLGTQSSKSSSEYQNLRVQAMLKTTTELEGDFLNVKKMILPNGITVLHKEDKSAPILSVVFSYHVGSKHETEETQGLAHLLEHMMFKGTRSRQMQWGRLLSVIGSQTNAFTTYGQTAYFHTIHKSALEPILELESDRMINSTLPQAQFDKEKAVVMSELTGDRNNIVMRLNEKVMEAAYRGYWPSRSVGGDSVMNRTRKQAIEFYVKAYKPPCLTIVVVGDVGWEELVRKIDRSRINIVGQDANVTCDFQIPRPIPVTLRNGFRANATNVHKVVMKETTAAFGVLEYIVPLCDMRDIADVAAIRVLEAILNGGLLDDWLKRLPFPSQSGVMANFEEDAGWMIMFAGSGSGTFDDIGQLDDAITGVGGLFEHLRSGGADNPVTPQLVTLARQDVVDATRADWFGDITSLAMHLSIDQTMTGNHMYTQMLLNATKMVTVQDIIRVANRYFLKNRLVVGAYTRGTKAEEEATIARYGTVEKFTDHPTVNNTAEYYKNMKCEIISAEKILEHVAALRYEEVVSNVTITSLPIAPPLCFATSPADCSDPNSFAPKRPMYWKLPNGMQILAIEDPGIQDTDTTMVFGHIDAGMEYDPEGYEGTSLMTALMMQLNVETYMRIKADEKASRGSGRTGQSALVFAPQLEGILIHGKAECDGFDDTLSALHMALTNSQFLSASEHATLQSLLSDMVDAMSSDPAFVIRQLMMQEIYPPDHPQMRVPSRSSIHRIPAELVQKFYINRICPETVKLAVVSGQFSTDSVSNIHRISALFEKWPECGRPKPGVLDLNNTDVTETPVTSNPAAKSLPGLAHAANFLKKLTGSSDGDIIASELRAVKVASGVEHAIQNGLNHGSQLLNQAFGDLSTTGDPATRQARTNVFQNTINTMFAAPAGPTSPLSALELDEAQSPAEELRSGERLLQTSRSETFWKTFQNGQEAFLDWAFGDTKTPGWLLQTPTHYLRDTAISIAGLQNDGFRFLNDMSDFREELTKDIAGKARSVSGNAQLKSKHHRPLLPHFMEPLEIRSHKSRKSFLAGDALAIGGSSPRQARSLNDIGSLVALSFSDITKLLYHSSSTEVEQVAARMTIALDTAPSLVGMMQRMASSVNRVILDRDSPNLFAGVPLKSAAPKPFSIYSLEDSIAKDAFAQMNHLRARLDLMIQNLPPVISNTLSRPISFKSVTLADVNRQLGELINDLEMKVPVNTHSDFASIRQQFHAIQPQLHAIGLFPAKLFLNREDSSPKNDLNVADSQGTNSKPEPTRGGALGMLRLPDIPLFPVYPPPLKRNGVIWLKKKIPGLHEALTLMMSDSVTHSDREMVAATVANRIIGGDSLSGKLGYWVRDCKGLTYHVASQLEISRHSGLLLLSMQTQCGAALDQAVNDTLNIIHESRVKGFTPAEVNSVKRNFLSSVNIMASDTRYVTQQILMDMVYSSRRVEEEPLDENMWTSVTQHVLDLETKEVGTAAKHAFKADQMIILTLAEDVEDARLEGPSFEEESGISVPEPIPAGARRPTPEASQPDTSGSVAPPSPYRPEQYKPPSVAVKAPHLEALHVVDTLQHYTSLPPQPVLPFQAPPAPAPAVEQPAGFSLLKENIEHLGGIGIKYLNGITGGSLDQFVDSYHKMNEVTQKVQESFHQAVVPQQPI